jgi:hypothetical protein
MRRLIAVSIAVALCSCIFALVCGEQAAAGQVEPQVAADKELLAKIEALPDNTWLRLGPVRTAGDLEWCGKPDWPNTENLAKFGPGGRDYCVKMAWAPERRRALFCGANHQTPHFINDIWEYDLAANTWICLYAPDPQYPARLSETAAYKGDLVRTRRGGPLRPCHTWWGLCYDAKRERLLWLDPHQGLIFTDAKRIAEALHIPEAEAKGTQGGPKDKKVRGSIIWEFDPAAAKWTGVQVDLPDRCEASCLEYLPDLQTLWYKGYGKTFLYEPDPRAWKQLTNVANVGYAMVSAYDPGTRTMVIVSPSKTYAYAFAGQEWKTVQENPPIGGRESSSIFDYDSAAAFFVLYTQLKPGGLWLYDLAKNEWLDPKPRGDVPPLQAGHMTGYYDPARHVTVLYDGKEVWVYRGKQAGPAVRPAGLKTGG